MYARRRMTSFSSTPVMDLATKTQVEPGGRALRARLRLLKILTSLLFCFRPFHDHLNDGHGQDEREYRSCSLKKVTRRICMKGHDELCPLRSPAQCTIKFLVLERPIVDTATDERHQQCEMALFSLSNQVKSLT